MFLNMALLINCKPKMFTIVYVFLMVFFLLSPWVRGESPQVPCYFIFGASAYDNGNNNLLLTTAKANYPPYGIDFPHGATGRFTNGRTITDIIAEFLGFEHYIPSFATARGKRILKGINYASGGSGIRDETGKNMGIGGVSMDRQLQHHQTTVSRIIKQIGDENLAAKYLNKCLYSVGMGTNDYVNNYLKPKWYPSSSPYTPEQYAMLLNQQFSQQLRTLYNYGARKVVLFGVPPLGCSPAVIAAAKNTSGSSCVNHVNDVVQLFNTGLRSLVDDLNNDLAGAKFILVNSYHIYLTSFTGFRVRSAPCCKISSIAALCKVFGNPCGNRSEYIWWDAIHLTEAANMISASKSYNSQSSLETYPVDIHSLAQL